MTNKKALRASLLAIFLIVTGIAVAAPPQALAAQRMTRNVHTPPPGSAERKAILDAMHLKIKELHGFDVVFAVKTMNVSGGWAWVHTLPQSRDGRDRYEDFSALLHNDNGKWRVDEIACTEPDNPDCIDNPGYFRKLAHRFPCAPSSIFPTASSIR
ncbi:hypothetical protein NY406_03725 [Chlorobaculum sp. MV4-Y]|uniref:hypothetical protein n=1 Tax=Chlorobaculum sp. MV4-Y TaxID=2976335 RepID=UPI0021AE3A61|nr:hypothetical protein [Chlorobaculum sp. MV4-Y]UWX58385.1 hypothetical protein NY406_03725 [Chlorobaculum sp. MV4-Y]